MKKASDFNKRSNVTSAYFPLLQQGWILLTLPQLALISVRAPCTGGFSGTEAYKDFVHHLDCLESTDASAKPLEMMDLLPAHSSPISMMTPEFYLPLLPSHCGQMSQLCFRLSPLGPGLEASELAASGPLITLLPLFEGRLLPFIPSCQLTTTGCDRIFQRTGVVCDHLLLTMCQAKVHPLFRELFLLVQSKSFL